MARIHTPILFPAVGGVVSILARYSVKNSTLPDSGFPSTAVMNLYNDGLIKRTDDETGMLAYTSSVVLVVVPRELKKTVNSVSEEITLSIHGLFLTAGNGLKFSEVLSTIPRKM